jgi:hypothetical protein
VGRLYWESERRRERGSAGRIWLRHWRAEQLILGYVVQAISVPKRSKERQVIGLRNNEMTLSGSHGSKFRASQR